MVDVSNYPTHKQTYEPIATITLWANMTSITLSSIPGIYKDLIAIVSGKSTANHLVYGTFNGDTSTNYSTTMLGDIYGANSGRQVNMSAAFVGAFDATNSSSSIIHIMSYANTSTYKTVLTDVQYGVQSTQSHVSLWRSTAAITQVTLTMQGGNSFTSGSTFSLYGIAG